MFHKKLKQMGAWLLAFSLVLGSAQLPAMEAKAADTNLALTATVSASSVEAASLPATKANDGDDNTRWASAVSSDVQTLQLSWESVQTMKSFVVKWERRNATEYAIEILKDDGTWESVASFNQKPTNTVQGITLNAPVQAKSVRLNIKAHSADGAEGETSWNNVSVWEFEVYEGEIPDNRTEMEKLVDSIQAPQVSEDGTHISMPELPEGATARFCADYEQVIGEDGTIYTPVENKTVKGFYEVTKGEETAKTGEFAVTVPGQYTNGENANVKPAVIPELQEWHGTTGQFAVSESSRIITGEGLEDTAESFAADYKEITGQDIQVVKGSSSDAKIGDFCLELIEDNQGLGKEGYVMTVGNFVKIEASDAVGAYWGVVSALQILKQKNGSIPKGIARDYPKYEVRAFSFDVGRKPISLDAVTQFARNMSWYKMNSLQLHLSDNLIFHEDHSSLKEAQENSYAGFRLESSLKPEEDSMVDTLHSQDLYYTKDEMRSLVKESRVRGLNIVPEFDMPAHALPITRAFPSLQSTTAGGHGWLIEELDLTQIDAVTKLAKDIWNDYFTDYDGNGPVFDEETTVHIGTDEFHGGNNAGTQVEGQQGKELFRQFSANMIKFIQGTGRTVRMWGSLTNKAGTTEVPSKDVQLNIWNTGYANPVAMYDLGYDLINTLEGPNYIVPAAGYYNDYVNAQSIYNSWQPNVIGNKTLMAGDDQMLGGCYAIWHDSVDTRANGISEYDSFDRFFKAVPAYGAKLWGDAKRNYKEFTAVAESTGTAPGTTLYGEVDSATKTILNYTFDETVEKDSSANAYNGTENKNVSQVAEGDGKALKLNGGESYVETPEKIDKIGDGASLTVKVKMDADADGEQILCESKDEFGTYGTYAIKAVQKNTGKVGFSREGYDYSFNYTLPKGEWVELTFKSGNGTGIAELYVNGDLVDNKKYDENGNLATTLKKNQQVVISQNNNPDIYFANHPETELSEKLTKEGITKTATMLIPVGRIGSKTKSFKGEIDYLTVTGTKESSIKLGLIPQSELTAGACSTHSTEGSIAAMLDGDTSTYWHTDYSQDSEKGDTKDHDHYVTLTLKNAKTVNKLSYLPRQDSVNGRITEYSIDIVKQDGTTVKNYASGKWASDMTEKTASFDPIEAKEVKLNILVSEGGNHGTAAEMNLYEQMTFGGNELQQEIDKYADYEEKDYTATSWNAFVQAREEALKVMNSADSTQDDYLYAYGELQKVAAALTEKPAVYKLIDAVAESDEVKKEDYEAAEYGEYEKALAAAQEVLADVNATEARITEAVQRVVNAKAALVPKRDVNKEEISTSIADAEKLLENTAGYTAASVAVLKEAVANAKAVLEDPKATQADIDAALKALQDAKLVKEESPTPTPNPGGDKPTPNPGGDKPTPNPGDDKPTPNPGNPTPVKPSIPAAGTVVTVRDVQYKVTKSDAQNGTAAAVKLMKKTAKKITIQSAVTIEGVTFKVTEVNAKVFQKAKKLTAVTIGANVKKIGAKAFFKCAKLKKVTFKGIKAPSIGKQAFKGTAAKCKVTAPKKMAKKQFNLLKSRLKKSGMSKKTVYKK